MGSILTQYMNTHTHLTRLERTDKRKSRNEYLQPIGNELLHSCQHCEFPGTRFVVNLNGWNTSRGGSSGQSPRRAPVRCDR